MDQNKHFSLKMWENKTLWLTAWTERQVAWVQTPALPLSSSWPGATCYTSVSLNFLACKMGIRVVPISYEGMWGWHGFVFIKLTGLAHSNCPKCVLILKLQKTFQSGLKTQGVYYCLWVKTAGPVGAFHTSHSAVTRTLQDGFFPPIFRVSNCPGFPTLRFLRCRIFGVNPAKSPAHFTDKETGVQTGRYITQLLSVEPGSPAGEWGRASTW